MESTDVGQSPKCKALRHICDTKARSIHPPDPLFRGDAGHVFVKVLLSLERLQRQKVASHRRSLMEVCSCRLSYVTGLCISHESVTQEGDGHRFYASLNQVCLNCNDAIMCFMGSFWEVNGKVLGSFKG